MPRILIADDEPDIIEMIRRYAEREGYEVTAVGDGSEAVEACREHDFDVIIMDVMMPDTEGFTACKKIRENKDIPVLMLSARGTIAEITDGYILIDDSVLCKDPADGIRYKVLLDDIWIFCFIDKGFAKAGDIVQIMYEGKIDYDNANLVEKPVDISLAYISEGEVIVNE